MKMRSNQRLNLYPTSRNCPAVVKPKRSCKRIETEFSPSIPAMMT